MVHAIGTKEGWDSSGCRTMRGMWLDGLLRTELCGMAKWAVLNVHLLQRGKQVIDKA